MNELTLFQLQAFTYSITASLEKRNNYQSKSTNPNLQYNVHKSIQTSKIKCTKLTNYFETVMRRIVSRNRQSNCNSFISNLFQRFESIIEIILCFCKGIYREKL